MSYDGFFWRSNIVIKMGSVTSMVLDGLISMASVGYWGSKHWCVDVTACMYNLGMVRAEKIMYTGFNGVLDELPSLPG
jgi:hypothetical protein